MGVGDHHTAPGHLQLVGSGVAIVETPALAALMQPPLCLMI
jgi:hypothetical protein